ncbi:MAG: hypothetical protein V1809_00415 [Planctomycetota bacterium]
MHGRTCVSLALALGAGLLMGGCGGSSSSSSDSGAIPTGATGIGAALSVASRVSVVDTSASGAPKRNGVAPLKVAMPDLAAADLPATSDYATDVTDTYVQERSSEAFSTVNEILCMIKQSKYDEMVNLGAYVAQIDVGQCSTSRDDVSEGASQNQSSGSDMPEYELWTVNSYRENDNSPHVIYVWLHQAASEWDPAQVIMVKMVITAGVSATNPFGLFSMTFKSHPETDGVVDTSVEIMRGLLRTEIDANGQILLKFTDAGGFQSNTWTEAATLNRSVDGTTGSGSYAKADSGPWGSESTQGDFAFNPSLFKRRDAGTGTEYCLNRTAFEDTVWQYGLYNAADGSRVNRNSGFPVKYVDGAGKEYQGWVGYWGMWFPEDVTVPNGAVIYKMDYNNQVTTPETMTAVVAKGKMIKHTRKLLNLGDVKQIPLDTFDPVANKQVRVVWDGTIFKKVAELDQTNGVWTELAPVAMDLSAMQWTQLNFFSQALGGQVRVSLVGCVQGMTFNCTGVPSNATEVVMYYEDIVYPSDATVPANFICANNAPNAAALTTANPFYADASMQGVAPAVAVFPAYTFDKATMTLTDNTAAAPVALEATNAAQQFGIQSGPMFEGTPANRALLACDFDANQTCAWKAWDAFPVFYTWETGTNNWNRFSGLRKADGTFVAFEPPLQVVYAHTGDGYTGAKFFLEYSGFGNLNGIPGKCVDRDTGELVPCGPQTRWIPEFNLPNGATVTDSANNQFYVKALSKEQRLVKLAAADCAALTLSTYTLPSLSEWTDPAIGTEPDMDDVAPAVIGGVLQ